MKSLTRPLILAIGICSAPAYGNTTWQPVRTYNMHDAASKGGLGNQALTDMSYWTNGLGQVGSGAPTADDDLVFDKAKVARLRFHATTTGDFTFNSLQIGTDGQSATVVHDGGRPSFANSSNGGLKFKYGDWFFNNTTSMQLDCDVTVLAEDATKPFVLHYGQTSQSNNVASILGKLKGSENAQLLIGPWPQQLGNVTPACAPNATFALYDISAYAGTITVTSIYENVVAGDQDHGYGTRLRLMTGTTASQAKIKISRGGSLSLQNFGDTVTVKELSLAAGSRLWFNHSSQTINGSLWCVKATDALTVDGPVEIYSMPIIRGIEHFRIPILVGPADSTFTENDFYITYTDEKYNLDLHLEVGTDEITGDRTLYVVTHGFVIQKAYSSTEGARGGGENYASSITNDACWWNGLAPNPTNSAAAYRTAVYLSTPYAPTERYEFPCAWFWLNGGKLSLQTRTFEVPELYCDGNCMVAATDSHENVGSQQPIKLIAPHIHIFKAGSTLTIRAYRGNKFVVDGEIDGPGDISILSWGTTSSPKASYELTGMNTNFTGSISVSQAEYRDAYISFESKFPTLYVNDGRNLGGRKDAFDPRALTLTHMAKLYVTNATTVTLADGLNRGAYVLEKGRFDVVSGGTIDVQWPILLSGKMWKEGPGTLILGGAMKHEDDDGGNLTDVPRAGSNLFEIVQGTVKIANADALAGVETTIDAGAALQLAIDPANADLTQYGIRNMAVDTPFTLDASFGGKLPLTLDTAGAVPVADCAEMTNALVTVKSSSAEAVGAMLSAVKPWRNYGYASTVVSRANGDGTTTLLLVSKFSGLKIYLR